MKAACIPRAADHSPRRAAHPVSSSLMAAVACTCRSGLLGATLCLPLLGPFALAAAESTSGPARSELSASTPDLQLLEASGNPIALRKLLDGDGPVMVNFIFTSCAAICPLMTETFARVQKAIVPTHEPLRMVSISIDPEVDRPAVLQNYAANYHAGPQWHFVTGSSKDIDQVERAFGTWHQNKMDHAALVFLRASPSRPWVRMEGLVSADAILREYRSLPK